ncbi:hypothetical protein [Microbacterium sp. cf332]|uniref:hypothetical protein n=1 Tax=Microbacterium sp. cf332 TaxID=1761804 RepID=UPI000883CFEC|nr:hypothetical protein [Microbacterium sp. cf332]SDQ29992.1 hypothetical protein SAMN04487847_1306 [Microbacterium sp. cf332]
MAHHTSRTAVLRLRAGVIIAAIGLAALTGCTPAASDGGAATTAAPATTAPVDSSPAPSASASEASTGALDAAALSDLFSGIQFRPGEYDSTAAMLESIYPGLTVSDAACLAPFGAGWESADAAVEYGTSNDRSMTAVVASAADEATAEDLVAQADGAIATCADGQELFAMQGVPITTSVAPFDLAVTGADAVQGWRVTGDVGGSPFTLVGATVRVGQNALALVGWDPETSADYVPQATQLFVDRIAQAAG